MTFLNRLFGRGTRIATLNAELLAKNAEVLAKNLYHHAQVRADETNGMLESASPRVAQMRSSVAGEERLEHILTVALVTATLANLVESGEEVAIRECTRRVFERVSSDEGGAIENGRSVARLRDRWNASGSRDYVALSNHLIATGIPSQDAQTYRVAIGS